jgi:selenocysteine lyase/cysteine desulfurase
MTQHDLALIRDDIPYLQKGIYLDNASVSPLSRRVRWASENYDAIIFEQLRDAKALTEQEFNRGRQLAARLVGCAPEDIAYVQNTSHGLSLVALGVDWRAGDNLVICAEEFPSNYLCWIQLAASGVEIRLISSSNGRLDPAQFEALVDGRTRVVAVSHVQFQTGFRVDLTAVAEICRKRGTLLVVDGTQSIGAIGLDVASVGIDVLVLSAHKWLMGPRGIGFAAFSSRAMADIKPKIIGWQSVRDPFEFRRTLEFHTNARRFESGTLNGCGIFGLSERLAEIDELGIDWIEQRILGLTEQLVTAALAAGLHVVHRFADLSRSGIILLQKKGVDVARVHACLSDQGIFTSVRSGAIRMSPHYYSTQDEIEHAVAAMAKVSA